MWGISGGGELIMQPPGSSHRRTPVSIFCHSCEEMPELESQSVALIVTSFPYYNAIDYDIHARDRSRNYRERTYTKGFDNYLSYLAWIQRIFLGEVWRVTKPGRFLAVVVGSVLRNGQHLPLPADVTHRLTDGGWEYWENITWHKTTAGVKRAGTAIQQKCPGYFYPNIMTETILIFRKPGPLIYQGKSRTTKVSASFAIDQLFVRDVANDIWHIAPVPPGLIAHPCPFPEEIPFRLIQLYSFPGDLVLDPFAGSGQTLKVAHALGRFAVGYESIPAYAELARRRIGEPLHVRKEQLVAKFEKIALGIN